jgi:hypothetical protein
LGFGGVVGEDRIRRITNVVGDVDDHALEKLKALFPNEFFEVADARYRKESARKEGTIGLMDRGEAVGEALSPDVDTPNSG